MCSLVFPLMLHCVMRKRHISVCMQPHTHIQYTRSLSFLSQYFVILSADFHSVLIFSAKAEHRSKPKLQHILRGHETGGQSSCWKRTSKLYVFSSPFYLTSNFTLLWEYQQENSLTRMKKYGSLNELFEFISLITYPLISMCLVAGNVLYPRDVNIPFIFVRRFPFLITIDV